MSIAWSTVIVVVMLLPGFLFLTGFYFPEKVTRESAPISPLGQLSSVVGIAFLLHAIFYCIINFIAYPGGLPFVRPIAIDHFITVLRVDSGTMQPAVAALEEMFNQHALRILTYFVSTSGTGFLMGWSIGVLIVKGPLRSLASHRWIYHLIDGTSAALGLVRAHVLSKTSHSGRVIVYDGIVEEFYANANGTINHLVLKDAHSGILEISDNIPVRHANRMTIASNDQEPIQFLVLTSDDIANLYFERIPAVVTTDAARQKLQEALDGERRSSAPTGEPQQASIRPVDTDNSG